MERQNKPAWITGAGGLIGNYLVQTAPKYWSAGILPASRISEATRRQDAGAPRLAIRALTRDWLDLLDFAAVCREFQKDRPQLVIHCAAVSTIAGVEADPELARRLNIKTTKLLAELAAEIQFVFFSTDLIFDGRQGDYVETDAPNPLHLYGETKGDGGKNCFEKSTASGRAHVPQRRGFAHRRPRFQRAHETGVAIGADDEIVHRRISLAHPGGGNRAGSLGFGGEKLRRDISRRRRGKIVALADWKTPGETLAGIKRENRAGVSCGFSRPGARARHVAQHFQSPKNFVRTVARIERMAGGKSGRAVLSFSAPSKAAEGRP